MRREGVATFGDASAVSVAVSSARRNRRGRRPSGGRVRPSCAALRGLDLKSVLDYEDASLDRADPMEAARRRGPFRRVRPHVVISFSPTAPQSSDHIAISQLTTAAIVATAGDHQVAKLYQIAWTEKWSAYQAAFRNLSTTVGGC